MMSNVGLKGRNTWEEDAPVWVFVGSFKKKGWRELRKTITSSRSRSLTGRGKHGDQRPRRTLFPNFLPF